MDISIYHKPGPFVYVVWKCERPLYVGGTEDVNAKVFKFDFEFDNITGHYYDFPDFGDEIDRKIIELKPLYNSRLRAALTKKQIIASIHRLFDKYGIPFMKREKERVSELLRENGEPFEFDGELYYSSMDAGCIEEIMRDEYGIYGFKS